jgi:uncharacterized protein YceH (UPF0502 family)
LLKLSHPAIPKELLTARQQEAEACQQAEARVAALEAELAQYRERFGDLPQD